MVFAQVIMLCDSPYYISLIPESIKNIGVTGTSNIYEKEVQDSKGADTCPFILSRNRFNF